MYIFKLQILKRLILISSFIIQLFISNLILASDLPQNKNEYVILLHGLIRTNRSMAKMETELIHHGYKVLNVDYPSTKYSIEYIADSLLSGAVENVLSYHPAKIHFITHSLGGIIVRSYLSEHKLDRLGRVVMLSPPNRGSELVDILGDTFFFKIMNGIAGQELGTDSMSVPVKLGTVDFELGVIAGNKSLNPIYSRMIPGSDDGKVSVERTKVKGMVDFIELPYTHTFIMRSDEVIDQTINFLKFGKFKH